MSQSKALQLQRSSLLGNSGNSRRTINKPFVKCRRSLRASKVTCQAGCDQRTEEDCQRRQVLALGGATLTSSILPSFSPQPAAAAARLQSGYTPIKDAQDGYSFLSPFGWQEVSVKGQDVVYKDVIEPLESVSVSLTSTDKKDITEYGSPLEIAATLTREVLTPSNQSVKVLGVNEREADGRKYVEFEFASKATNYIRHALASVTIANGKFYTLTTGANEFRWDKMKDRLKTVVASFEVVDRYPTS